MDKYHIYEEVGAGKHSQVFKGREKMDIEYVAIKRIEKSKMDSVVNEVQVIHRLSSPNVLKFYDWYETRNNVWLILEFCTGGDLSTVIKQDNREPESAVRLFGVDLLAGLQQTHACGFLHGDLRPSNVLIDEYGILKLSGFALARSIPAVSEPGGEKEDLSKHQLQSLGGTEGKSVDSGIGKGRDPTYMAPELFLEGEAAMSFASDFWSLGCVLFELLIGEPPFRASPSATVAEKIKLENPSGLSKGEWQGARMGPQFCDLVGWLLEKDPLRRPTWPQLLAHPFWGKCQTPSPLEMPVQPRFDRAVAIAVAKATQVTEEALTGRRGGVQQCSSGPNERGRGRLTLPVGVVEQERQRRRLKAEVEEELVRWRSSAGKERDVNCPGDKASCVISEVRIMSTRSGRASPNEEVIGSDAGTGGGEEEEGDTAIGTASQSRNDSGKMTSVDPPEKQRSKGQYSARQHRLEARQGRRCSDHRNKPVAAKNGERLHPAEKRENSAPLPTPQSASERQKAPNHEYSTSTIDDIRTAPDRGCGASRKEKEGNSADADIARRAAAALNGLRLRGRIPPGREGRKSPSVLSVVSASSSVGEQYGSSFEEDTEGSNSCSTGGGIDVELAATLAPAEKIMTAGSGRRNEASAVMTPGSVGTATTATPSTGCASSARGRGLPAAVGARFDRRDGILGRDSAVVLSSSHVATIAAEGSSRPLEDMSFDSSGTSVASTGSVSGCGYGSRLNCQLSTTVASDEAPNHSFAVTALSFGTAVGSPASERVSTSSWTLSSAARGSREIGSCSGNGGEGGGYPGQDGNGQAVHGHTPDEMGHIHTGGARNGLSEKEMPRGMQQRTALPASDHGQPSADARRELPPEQVRMQGRPAGSVNGITFVESAGIGIEKGLGWSIEGGRGVRELLLHSTDAQVTPIVSNRPVGSTPPHVSRSSRDQLPFEALLPGVVSAMPPLDLEAHLTVVYNALTEVSASVRQRGQTLLYLQSLAQVPRAANLIINSTFLVLLLRMLCKPRPAAIRDTVTTLIGLLVRHATYIAPGAGKIPGQSSSSTKAGENSGGAEIEKSAIRSNGETTAAIEEEGGLMSVLVRTVREKPAPGRAAQAAALRRNTVAALGELLFYIVTQEPHNPYRMTASSGDGGGDGVGGGSDGEAWSIPTTPVGAAIRMCLEDAEYEGVRHYAAKTVENVLAQAGPSHPLVQVFVTLELALCLLDLARYASSESQRGTAAAGLSHMLGHDTLGEECEGINSSSTWRPVSVGGESGDGRRAKRGRTPAGWVTSHVMCESGAPSVVVNGLSEGCSPSTRRAFLNIFNLVVWASRNGSNDSGRYERQEPAHTARKTDSNNKYGFAGQRHHPLCRPVKAMIESQQLLPRLLRVAEYEEGTILRAKGFLALRLALEAAPPALLLKACRSRLLPLLARVIGAMTPRTGGGSVMNAASTPSAVLGLSAQQEYLYECSTRLLDWLGTVPEKAAKRLLEELRRHCAGCVLKDSHYTEKQRPRDGSSSRWAIRQPMAGAMEATLEAAMEAFPAVVHLISSPLLRKEATTRKFISDVASCLALSCPIIERRRSASGGLDDDVTSGGMVRSVEDEGSGTKVVLAALLPTVETLAQQAEKTLVPHSEAVCTELIPVLCRLLRSSSGDTRALALAVLRVLLPPLLRQNIPPHPQLLERGVALNTGISSTVARAVSVGSSPPKVQSAIISHLLPVIAILLSDHPPIPQYTIRLLVDVGREWSGLRVSLLVERGIIPALLGRLPRPLPLLLPPSPQTARLVAFPPSSSLWPPEVATHTAVGSSPSNRQPEVGVRHQGTEPGDELAIALDPALATLLTLLIEIEPAGQYLSGGSGADDKGSSRDKILVVFLRLELPGRVAAAVVSAVAARLPEAAEAFLSLAVALLGAGVQRERGGKGGGRSYNSDGGSRGGVSSHEARFREVGTGVGERRGSHRTTSSWVIFFEPLLAAVAAAVEGLQLFSVRSGLTEQQQQVVKSRREAFVNDSVRSGISDSATVFLEACHQLFHVSLLRSLLLSAPLQGNGGSAPPSSAPGVPPASAARTCRQLAEFLGSPNEDKRPQLRVLRLLFAAASTIERPFRAALGQGSLWTALLRLATGRSGGGGADSIGKARARRPVVGGGRISSPASTLGPTHALARDVVGLVRESRGGVRSIMAAEPCERSGRVGGADRDR